MATELDDELREDFLSESRELLERLAAQLVELERTPDDRELLNAIFRGFHTIKGSAGFFDLNAVVELAHAAEEVFNALRAGSAHLRPEMLDAVLEALDDLGTMLAAVAQRRKPKAPRKVLIEALNASLVAQAKSLAIDTSPEPSLAAPASEGGMSAAQISADPFSDDEFEALLNALQSGQAPTIVTPPSNPSPSGRGAGVRDVQGVGAVGSSSPAHSAPMSLPMGEAIKAQADAHTPNEIGETSVRVDTQRLDRVMSLVGELVLVRNRIKNLGGPQNAAMRRACSELDLITSSLQAEVMRMRMQPIRKLFSRFPRLARDTARRLGKQVEVTTLGDDTELDKTLVEALADPLMHMVRNAIDHGLEMPDARAASGKPAAGTLSLSAEQLGEYIIVTVRDDGAGMDPEKLKRKALERSLITDAAAAAMSRAEALQLIFLAGFSTKEQVSDLSGRGVGMDVVRSNIRALNGSVSIDSELGRGSAIQIRVPLTLAIQPVLMCELAGRLFAVPLQPVQDVFTLDTRLTPLDAAQMLYRSQTLHLLWLPRWARVDDVPRHLHVVVVDVGSQRWGIVVGQVRGREEIVVKPLGRMLRQVSGLAGATVTGDGRIALILELAGLAAACSAAMPREAA